MQPLPFSKLLYNQHLTQQYQLRQNKDNEVKETKTDTNQFESNQDFDK